MSETTAWMEKSNEDFDVAQFNLEGKKYSAAVFFAQQSCEKAMKALYIRNFKELLKVHDIALLAKKLSAPDKIIEYSHRLSTYYISSCYPDYSHKLGSKEALNCLAMAEKVI